MNEILPRIKKLLKKYPSFFQKYNSNLYKHAFTVNNQFLDLNTAIKILDMSRNIERPIKIRKIQNIEHKYIINVDVSLSNLKKFSFYKEKNNGEIDLIYEEYFDKNTNFYSYNFEDQSDPIIPEDKFFVVLETYDEYLFIKGFPENDEKKNDIYDHDEALDVLGENLNVSRKRYIKVSEGLLYKTEPPFNTQLSEDDYHYQERIIKYVNEFEKSFLPVLEIWKFYSLNTIAQNRHHLLAKQNISVMRDDDNNDNVKYMRTKTDYHPTVYDIFGDYDEIPSNIKLPMGDEVIDLIQKSLPLTRKAFLNFSAKKIIPQQQINVVDNIINNINFLVESDNIYDNPIFSIDSGESFFDNSSVIENINLDTENGENNSVFENISAVEDYLNCQLTPDSSFETSEEVYIDDDLSEAKLELNKNELPNTLSNSESLTVTRDMSIRSGDTTFTYYNPSNYISIFNDNGENVYKILAPTNNVKNYWFWFSETAQDYYTSSKCITHYLHVPYPVTISFDINLPINKKLKFGAYKYDSNKTNSLTNSIVIEGTGEYQRVSLNVDTSQSYPFLMFFLADADVVLGLNNPFFIKKLCINKGDNKKYVKSRLIDTGWLNPTKAKGYITSVTSVSSNTLNIDANKGFLGYPETAANAFLPYTYVGGFYNSSTIPPNANIKKTFGSWAKEGMHNTGSPRPFAESSPGTVTNYFGPCQYDSESGISYIPTYAIKNKNSCSVYENKIHVNSAIIDGGNNYIKSNPSDFSMRIRLRNNSSSPLFLGFEFVSVRSWYEIEYHSIEGDLKTPLIDLNNENGKITKIEALDSTPSWYNGEIIYSVLDEEDNLILQGIIFPFLTDHLLVDKIKIISRLFSYNFDVTPVQKGYVLYSSKKYNL